MRVKIDAVEAGSIAEEIGIEAGDYLVSVNGKTHIDVIVYRFEMASEYVEIEIEDNNGDTSLFQIEKEYDEDMGLVFDNFLMDKPKSCKNNCIFCFIDQLPKKLRKTLYFKDDDARLSFLHGNYVTLTNMSDEELQRLIEYKVSPINISVHATNGDVRQKILRNPKASDLLRQMKFLADGGIEMNAQIVLCPGINDGDILVDTLETLSTLRPQLISVAIVPVAQSDYRDGLFPIVSFDKDRCRDTIERVEALQSSYLKDFGTSFAFLADEFYLGGEWEIPDYSHYEDFHQLEDGIGMLSKLRHEFLDYLGEVTCSNSKEVTLVTGTLAFDFVDNLLKKFEEKCSCIRVNIFSVVNKTFGSKVTVSGLLCGNDIYDCLKDKSLGNRVLIPSNAMAATEDVFLDDVTLVELSNKLGVECVRVNTNGMDLLDAITERGLYG